VSGYEYGNARLRAMRSRLLGAGELADLLAAGTLDRMLGRLADTAFGPDVEAAIPRAKGLRRLDTALRGNLSHTLTAMAGFYEGGPGKRVALLLDRWVREDLRTLVRLPAAPGDTDVGGLLVPMGALDSGALAELARHANVRDRVELAVAWRVPSADAAAILRRALPAYERTGDRSVLEAAVDAAFARRLSEVLGDERSRGGRLLRAEVDARNLLTALRIRRARQLDEPVPDDDPYVEGGNRPADAWAPLADEEDPERIAGRPQVDVIPGWDTEVAAWASHHELTRLADGLRRRLTTEAVAGFASGDPLGFDVPVAFTFAKEAEIRDVRLVGRAIVHGLGPDEVLGRLETAA
jgi:vacuolar-type H+-ATPase subunit C/Vma6